MFKVFFEFWRWFEWFVHVNWLNQPLVWFSSSKRFILFMTARPIRSCFSLSSSCVDLLVYSAVENIWMFELKLKTSEIDLLCALINWQPMGLLERTINGYTLLIVPSRENKNVSFMLSSPLSSCMYVKEVDWNGWRNLRSQPFKTWCRMKCWVFFKSILQQCVANIVISPEWIWFQCTSLVHVIWKEVCSHVQPLWWKWNDRIRPVILCPYALKNSTFPSLQRLVDYISSRYVLTLSHNSLCLAFLKHSESFSLKIFSGISVFDISSSLLLTHLCVIQNWGP